MRISHGPSVFGLEWLILSALELVNDQTPIVAEVHDCQIVELDCPPLSSEVGIDQIITPTQLIDTARPSPASIKTLPLQIIREVPLLQELAVH